MSAIKSALFLGAVVVGVGYATTSTTSTVTTEAAKQSPTPSPTQTETMAATATTTSTSTPTPIPQGYTVRAARDFGVMCDGVKDDTVSLQYALNALRSYQALQLPSGTCLTSKQLYLSSKTNVAVVGGGKESTILHAKDPLHSSFIVHGGSNILLRGFQVYAPTSTRRTSDPASKGFFIVAASNVVLEDLKARQVSGAGLLFWRVSNAVVRNSEVDRSRGDAFHFTGGSTNVLVQYNKASGSGDDCFASIGIGDGLNSNVRFFDNTCLDNNASGVSFEGTNGGQAYRNKLIRTGVSAIRVASQRNWNSQSVSNIDVRDNVLTQVKTRTDVDHAAIMVFTTYGNIKNITFANNEIQEPKTWVGGRMLNYLPGSASISGVSFANTNISTDGRVRKCFNWNSGVSGLQGAYNTLNLRPCAQL